MPEVPRQCLIFRPIGRCNHFAVHSPGAIRKLVRHRCIWPAQMGHPARVEIRLNNAPHSDSFGCKTLAVNYMIDLGDEPAVVRRIIKHLHLWAPVEKLKIKTISRAAGPSAWRRRNCATSRTYLPPGSRYRMRMGQAGLLRMFRGRRRGWHCPSFGIRVDCPVVSL